MDLNRIPIKIWFQTTAKLGETYGQTVWWEAEGIDIPILGMDNFKKLKLSVQQKKPTPNNVDKRADKNKKKTEKICFIEREIEDLPQNYTKKFAENIKKLFETISEVKNFNYNVNIRDD